ncbi:hypothetical protein ACFQY7_17810 [Actinomadura luteofluorescens]|uniref:hypothetical protein n=1 Tax=Actinomadura luteofluorescens TaxID=46163 RepID=UPI00363965BA
MTLAIAAAAAGKAVELTGQPVKDGIVVFGRKVRDRFRGRPADEEVLSSAVSAPDDGGRVALLAEALRRAVEEDPGFADDLEAAFQHAMEEDPDLLDKVNSHLQQARLEATANDEGVINVFTGTAEKVVQLRDVHGGLSIN